MYICIDLYPYVRYNWDVNGYLFKCFHKLSHRIVIYTSIYIYIHIYIYIYNASSALNKSVAGAPWRLDGLGAAGSAGSAGSAGAAHCLERRWIPSLDRLALPGKPTKSYGKSPKSPCFIGKINYFYDFLWPFSIDMLNCQRIAMSFPGDFKQR